MIISKTPLRISLAGGGTDISDYYLKKEGKVLSFTIDKFVYVIVKKRFDKKIVLNYSKKEILDNVNNIKHELIRESLKKVGISDGIEITTIADIHSHGSGLGSSSSITVGLLNALYTFKGKKVTKNILAEEACDIEINILNKPIGKQDQYAAAFGGFNEIIFRKDEKVLINTIKINPEYCTHLIKHFILLNTGITRQSSDILGDQKSKTVNSLEILTIIKNQVNSIKNIILNKESPIKIGDILNNGWKNKKKLSNKISNSRIDDLYLKTIDAGGLGGKICGAGGGGYFLIICEPDSKNKILKKLHTYDELPLSLSFSGTQIFNLD